MPSGSTKWAVKSFASFIKKKREQEYRVVNGEETDTSISAEDVPLRTEEESIVQGPNEDDEDFHSRLHDIQEQHRQRQMLEEQNAFLRSQEIRHLRILTIGYCLCYFALGLAFGATAPAIHLLQEQTDSTDDEINGIVAARGVGWIIGSVAAGKLFEKVRGHRLLWIALVLTTVSCVIIPLIPNIWVLCVIFAVSGAFMSWLEVGVNTLALWIWKEEVGPYMQFLHFAFGAGLGASPFIYGFVIDIIPSLDAYYWILAVLCIIPIVFPLRMTSPPIETDVSDNPMHGEMGTGIGIEENETLDPLEEELNTRRNKRRFLIIIPLVAGFMLLYGGAENIFGTWLYTYAFKVYDLGESRSAYIESAFWAALTAGRFFSVPLATRLSSRILLLADMLGVIIALVIGILGESFMFEPLLWFVTIVVGFSMASVFATAFTIPAELRVKGNLGRAASAFIVASGMGDMALPYIAGIIISSLGPSALLWTMLICFILCFVLYMLAFTYGLSTMERRLPESSLREIRQFNDYWH